MKILSKIIGGILLIASPIAYFAMLDRFNVYRKLIFGLGLIGYACVVGLAWIYIFKRDTWHRIVHK